MTLKDAATKWFLQNAILKFLDGLKKDRSKMQFLTGYKTFIVAGIILLNAGASALGFGIPGFEMAPGEAITYALGLIFARTGAKSEARKVAEGL